MKMPSISPGMMWGIGAIVIIVIIAIVIILALPYLGQGEASFMGMVSPEGAGAGSLLTLVTRWMGIETQQVSGIKTTQPVSTGATTPFHSFKIEKLQSTPTTGNMELNLPNVDTKTGQIFRISTTAANVGDKVATNLVMMIMPTLANSYCGPEQLIYGYTGDTIMCDTIFVDNEGNSVPFVNNRCYWTIDELQRNQRVQKICTMKFGCINNEKGCECDEEDPTNCGIFDTGYVPGIKAFLMGSYVSTTRLDVQFVNEKYFRLLELHEAPTSIKKPIRSQNTFGAMSLWTDAGFDTKQPILSGTESEFFLFRMQLEDTQGGRLITSPNEKMMGDIRLNSILGILGVDTSQMKSELVLLLPTAMVPESKRIGNLNCADQIKTDFCKGGSWTTYLAESEEFERVREDYCTITDSDKKIIDKTTGQPKYSICLFESAENGLSDISLSECYDKCEYFFKVPLLDEGINRETFIIRSDLLHYYSSEKSYSDIVTMSKVSTGISIDIDTDTNGTGAALPPVYLYQESDSLLNTPIDYRINIKEESVDVNSLSVNLEQCNLPDAGDPEDGNYSFTCTFTNAGSYNVKSIGNDADGKEYSATVQTNICSRDCSDVKSAYLGISQECACIASYSGTYCQTDYTQQNMGFYSCDIYLNDNSKCDEIEDHQCIIEDFHDQGSAMIFFCSDITKLWVDKCE